jgi:uncharacterized small protein (DUF1192 family)
MDDEELTPKVAEWPPKTLEHMSLDALEAYGRALQAELARVKRIVESRTKERAAADAIFKR